MSKLPRTDVKEISTHVILWVFPDLAGWIDALWITYEREWRKSHVLPRADAQRFADTLIRLHEREIKALEFSGQELTDALIAISIIDCALKKLVSNYKTLTLYRIDEVLYQQMAKAQLGDYDPMGLRSEILRHGLHWIRMYFRGSIKTQRDYNSKEFSPPGEKKEGDSTTIILLNGEEDKSGKTWEEYNKEREIYTLFVDEPTRKLWTYGDDNSRSFEDTVAYELLCLIACTPRGNILYYKTIYEKVWPPPHGEDEKKRNGNIQKIVERYITPLFDNLKGREKYIRSIPGQGYQTTDDIKMIIRRKNFD